MTGSHQNVFTMRLIEGMDLARISPKLLDLNLFPTGVKYHHDRPFMRGLLEGLEHPYNFHMYVCYLQVLSPCFVFFLSLINCLFYRCWTLNKQDKINYFHKAGMWFLQEKGCDIEDLKGPVGSVFQKLASHTDNVSPSSTNDGNLLRGLCCKPPDKGGIKTG